MGTELFSEEAVAGLIRAGDTNHFNLDLAGERLKILAGASTAIISREIDLSAYLTARVKSKPCIAYNDFNTHILLRGLSRHLRRRLRITPPSRDRIIRGVIEALLDGTPMFVVRRDISSFYESIPIHDLREALIYDTSSSSLVRYYLKQFFDAHCSLDTGLPRGVGLSALMAEIVMRPFDAHIRELPSVYRYYRFSDDILIFATEMSPTIDATLLSLLPQGMQFGPDKRATIFLPGKTAPSLAPVSFDYLGYQFSSTQTKNHRDSREVRLSIASRKMDRFKTRIILSVKAYKRSGNFALLSDRILFLASNYRVLRKGVTHRKYGPHVYSGIYYNYHLCGTYNNKLSPHSSTYDCRELKHLDGFYNSLLTSLARSDVSLFTAAQLSELRRYSFSKAYSLRIRAAFKPLRVHEIRGVWLNA